MPEITITFILVTMGFNLLGLFLLARDQYSMPKFIKPNAKKRLSMSVLSYMIIGANVFIFAYVWKGFIENYVTVEASSLPLQIAIGVMSGGVLSLWMKNHLIWQLERYLELTSKPNLLRLNARWHQGYLFQFITIFGGLLVLLDFKLTLPNYVLVLMAGVLACLMHASCRSRKNMLFQFFYSAIWMLVCLLTLNALSIFIAIVVSYLLISVLLIKGAIKVSH